MILHLSSTLVKPSRYLALPVFTELIYGTYDVDGHGQTLGISIYIMWVIISIQNLRTTKDHFFFSVYMSLDITCDHFAPL